MDNKTPATFMYHRVSEKGVKEVQVQVPVGAKGTCCQCSTKVSCIESNIITAENGLRYLYCYWCKIDWNIDEEWYEYHK